MDCFKRNYKIDNIKALLIFLVVIGHFVDELVGKSDVFKCIYIFVYSFHMPLFIFLSGYLSRKLIMSDEKEKIKDKVFIYIILGFLMKFIFGLCLINIKGKVSFSLLSGASAPWYLFVLASFVVLSTILKDKKFWPIFIFSIILACFVGYDNSIKDYLYLSRLVIFFPFFWLGFKVDFKKIIKKLNNRYVKFMFYIIIILYGTLVYFKIDEMYILRGLLTARHSFKSLDMLNYGFFIRFVYYIVSIVLSLGIVLLVPNKKFPLFTVIGSRTLPIYMFHCPIIYILVSLNVHELIANIDFINYKILWLMLAILTTLFLSIKLFSDLVNKIINLFVGKEKTNILLNDK